MLGEQSAAFIECMYIFASVHCSVSLVIQPVKPDQSLAMPGQDSQLRSLSALFSFTGHPIASRVRRLTNRSLCSASTQLHSLSALFTFIVVVH